MVFVCPSSFSYGICLSFFDLRLLITLWYLQTFLNGHWITYIIERVDRLVILTPEYGFSPMM
jgi:hypothetical protein